MRVSKQALVKIPKAALKNRVITVGRLVQRFLSSGTHQDVFTVEPWGMRVQRWTNFKPSSYDGEAVCTATDGTSNYPTTFIPNYQGSIWIVFLRQKDAEEMLRLIRHQQRRGYYDFSLETILIKLLKED